MRAAALAAAVVLVVAALASRRARDAAPSAAPGGRASVPAVVQLTREAEVALQSGHSEEALARATAALEGAPGSALAHNQAGRAAAARFRETGDPALADEARRCFQAALAADPTFWPALQNLGDLEERAGHPTAAAGAYRRLLAASPGHPDRSRLEAAIARAAAGSPHGARRRAAAERDLP